ncbi:MAG: TonB-dependent receptor [Gemmatimonadaceae bacterium]
MHRLDQTGVRVVTVVAALVAIAAQGTAAQSSGTTLRGVVRSISGPVVGANVFVLETLDGVLADSTGAFVIQTAAPLPLTLHVKRIGFIPFERVLRDANPIVVTLARAAPVLAPITVQAGAYTAGEERGATLTPLEVVTTPGTAADVNRAIQLLPGVQAVDDGTALFVRGGDFTETKAFLNEAPLLNPVQLLTPSGTFVGTVDPFQLDGIFFSSGGFGARYGDALSGVIGLRTRGAAQRSGATLGAGLAALSADGSLRVSPELSVRVAGNRFDLEPFLRVNSSSRSYTPPPHGRDVSASAIWTYRPSAEVKVFGIDQTNILGVDLDEPSFSGTFDVDVASRLLVTTWRDVFGSVAPLVSISETRLTRHEQYGAFVLDANQRQRQLHAQLAWQATGNLLVRGGGELDRLTSDLAGSLPKAAYDQGPGTRTTVFAVDQPAARNGAFIELDWRVASALRVTPGIRTDHSNLTDRTTIDPRVSVAWRLGSVLTMTGALGVYHQVPDPLHFADSVAGAGLLPMRARQAVVGLQAGEGALIFRVEAYHKRYDDLALQTRDFGVFTGGRGTSRGVDLFYKGRLPVAGIVVRSIASYLVARRTDPETGDVVRAPFDVSTTYTLIAERGFANGVRLAMSYRSATGKPFTPVIGATFDPSRDIYIPTYGAPMSERFPSLRRFDLSASRFSQITPTLNSVLYVSVNNLFDRANVQSWQYSRDYTERVGLRSIFNRSVYFGASLIWQ